MLEHVRRGNTWATFQQALVQRPALASHTPVGWFEVLGITADKIGRPIESLAPEFVQQAVRSNFLEPDPAAPGQFRRPYPYGSR